ncbi:hypothetical protein AFB00_08035 [Pseudonocardia sp. HH130630-07]|nr:hypothetical protein AFB00_08035 [Pseudonocardia sp. HH130630-07]
MALATAAVLLAVTTPATAAEPAADLDSAAVPEAARSQLDLITELTTQNCPELPPAWVVAQVQTESGWDADLRTGTATGLLQVSERTWVAAGGAPWPDPALTDPAEHLRVVVPWLCATLRAAAGYLATTPKDVTVLDAMLVCHLAGCRRVTGSESGVPAAGEADCSQACSTAIRRYLDSVHDLVGRYSGAPPADDREGAAPEQRPADPAAAPAPAWTGGATGCERPDPVRSGGCLTGAAEHGLAAATAVFEPVIDTVGCWDEHAQNPRSDHPKGRACDLFTGPAGRFAKDGDLDEGWRVARWFATNAEPLKVKYLIWQGRYWDPSVREDGTGWGRRYTGGGVYDTSDPTGGHFDHIHVSFAE